MERRSPHVYLQRRCRATSQWRVWRAACALAEAEWGWSDGGGTEPRWSRQVKHIGLENVHVWFLFGEGLTQVLVIQKDDTDFQLLPRVKALWSHWQCSALWNPLRLRPRTVASRWANKSSVEQLGKVKSLVRPLRRILLSSFRVWRLVRRVQRPWLERGLTTTEVKRRRWKAS